MYIYINKGYISESSIEYIELVADGNVTSIRVHLISGRTVEVTGELARRMLEYADRNKVEFLDRLYNPINLDGLTL
jgi:hypothetical protein